MGLRTDNNIGDSGARMISESLKINSTLTKLILRSAEEWHDWENSKKWMNEIMKIREVELINDTNDDKMNREQCWRVWKECCSWCLEVEELWFVWMWWWWWRWLWWHLLLFISNSGTLLTIGTDAHRWISLQSMQQGKNQSLQSEALPFADSSKNCDKNRREPTQHNHSFIHTHKNGAVSQNSVVADLQSIQNNQHFLLFPHTLWCPIIRILFHSPSVISG